MDTHYQEQNFICSCRYIKSGMMALISGRLFHELKVIGEIFRNLIRINPCLLSWQHISFERS